MGDPKQSIVLDGFFWCSCIVFVSVNRLFSQQHRQDGVAVCHFYGDISAEMAVSKFLQKVLKFSEYESWPANPWMNLWVHHGVHSQRYDGNSVKLVELDGPFVKFWWASKPLELLLFLSNRFIFFRGLNTGVGPHRRDHGHAGVVPKFLLGL